MAQKLCCSNSLWRKFCVIKTQISSRRMVRMWGPSLLGLYPIANDEVNNFFFLMSIFFLICDLCPLLISMMSYLIDIFCKNLNLENLSLYPILLWSVIWFFLFHIMHMNNSNLCDALWSVIHLNFLCDSHYLFGWVNC